jgi:hypothetical protein
MKYQSGEEIRKGDKVLFHSEPGEIQFVVEKLTGDSEKDWLMNEYGPGVMVLEPKFYKGGTFITDTENAEDLVLVSRSNGK